MSKYTPEQHSAYLKEFEEFMSKLKVGVNDTKILNFLNWMEYKILKKK